jgi:hypothetical protein
MLAGPDHPACPDEHDVPLDTVIAEGPDLL